MFEIIDYVQDYQKQACTSSACQWVKRKTWSLDKPVSVPVVELCTSSTSTGLDLTRYDYNLSNLHHVLKISTPSTVYFTVEYKLHN